MSTVEGGAAPVLALTLVLTPGSCDWHPGAPSYLQKARWGKAGVDHDRDPGLSPSL